MELGKYLMVCASLIVLYIILCYNYFSKYKADKPSYITIKKIHIIGVFLTIMNYILMISKYFSSEVLLEYYKKQYLYITSIYILNLLCSAGILVFYYMVEKRRGKFSQYDEVLIQ